MSARTNGRVHLNERRELRPVDPYDDFGLAGLDFSEAPHENPDFNVLFTEEEQDTIEARFARGIARGVIAEGVRVRAVRAASLACHERFNRPKRKTRKEMRASLGEIAHGPRR